MNIKELVEKFNVKGFYLRTQLAALIHERKEHIALLIHQSNAGVNTTNVQMAILKCDEGIEEYRRQIAVMEEKNEE